VSDLSRSDWIENFLDHYRNEVADQEGAIALMRNGTIGCWRTENGIRVDCTGQELLRSEQIVARLNNIIIKTERMLAAGEFD